MIHPRIPTFLSIRVISIIMIPSFIFLPLIIPNHLNFGQKKDVLFAGIHPLFENAKN